MGSSLKVNAVRDLVKSEQPDFLLLQETKISEQELKDNTKKIKNYEGIAINLEGASGGLGTLWNKKKWQLKDYKQNREKASCWESISADLRASQGKKIFLGGDLNLIRNAQEKLRGNFFADPAREALEDIIQAHNLIDTPLHNGNFTWSNRRTGKNNIKERLDRILARDKIIAEFQRIQSSIILGYISNHKPVALRLDNGSYPGPIPFKYNKEWDNVEGFKDLIKEQWAMEISGSPHFIWESKIKNLRNAIKQWARQNAALQNRKKIEIQQKLEQLNNDREGSQDSEEDQNKEGDLLKELYNQNRREEEEQRQKSRCLWLTSGDKNTTFFHNNMKLRRAANNIDKISVEGRIFSEQDEIKNAASRHFHSLLTAEPNYIENPDFLSSSENKITENQRAHLDKVITLEEIEWSLQSMLLDKAPGPDGFIVAFFKSHWDTIKKDSIRMVRNFFSKCKMGSSVKSTHLALIPKDPNPQTFDRFQPISLCNVSYKIISKILANRLKSILPSIISENQGGFVPSRQITDNVILIQEAIHSSIARNEKGMIIKLDMANAFDRVNHAFLKAAMKKFGISEFFSSRVMECISDIWTAPLVNGRPYSAFKSSRGLRQGCPLSPFLFILMAETLSLQLEHKRRTKEITGIDIVRGAKGINHSLFADDTLLIGGASSLMARRFKEVLDTFLQASGGKLNNSKCMIYTWNVPRHITQRISRIMEIPAQGNWSSFKYLGLPLAKENVKSQIWTKSIENMRSKLQSWGMHWLNLAGRSILIKSVLSALPIYQFAITLAPASTHKHMELIICSFLWQGGKQDSKKFSLVKWSKVILPLEKGGLGIKVPRLSNLAMGLKLIWKIINDKGSWWIEIIKKKYLNGANSNILEENLIDRPSTPVWKLIKKSLPQAKPRISKVPGNGKKIIIWHDRIMGTEARETLPNYKPLQQWMDQAKQRTLFDISQWNQNDWKGWKSLALPPNLENSWAELKNSLSGLAPINKTTEDKFIWDPIGGNYTVKDGYKSLQNSSAANTWPLYKVVWRIDSLPKIKIFNWTLLHGNILTAENLRKKGIQGPSICCLCKNAEETCGHLFIECSFARQCWNLIAHPLPSGDLPNQMASLQRSWRSLFPQIKKGKNQALRIWNSIPSNLCWQIWNTRNNSIFNDKKPCLNKTIAKTVALISETIEANGYVYTDPANSDPKVQEWVAKFKIKPSISKRISVSQADKTWKLRGTNQEVEIWIQKQNRPTLFFDGASKNNPGQAGAGGIIRDPHGKILVKYEWGLGVMSNNKAEAYNLLLGSSIAKKLGLQNLLILGDSAIIISSMNSDKDFRQTALNRIKDRITENLRSITGVSHKHILRENNKAADAQANMATGRPIGWVKENELEYEEPIP
eukprot:PITA_03539